MSFLRFRWVVVVKESDAVATRTSRHAQTQTHTQKRAYKRGIFHRGRVKLYILNVNLFFQRSVVDYYDRRWTRVSKKSAKEQRFSENARAKERENERERESERVRTTRERHRVNIAQSKKSCKFGTSLLQSRGSKRAGLTDLSSRQ